MNKKVSEFFNKNSIDYKNKYNSNNKFHNYFFNSRLKSIEKNLPKDIKYILDIGSGTGDVYDYLKSKNFNFKNYFATDISKKMLTLSKVDEDKKFCGDIWDSNYNQYIFNLILMIGVSSYMDEKTLKKNILFVSNNLKNNGLFIITINNNKSIDLFNRKIFRTFFKLFLPNNSILRNFTPSIYDKKDINKWLNINMKFDLIKVEKHNFTIFPFNLIFPIPFQI